MLHQYQDVSWHSCHLLGKIVKKVIGQEKIRALQQRQTKNENIKEKQQLTC